MTIWPKFDSNIIADESGYRLQYATMLRKQSEGKYYLIPVTRSVVITNPDNTHHAELEGLKFFIADVYNVQNFYILQPSDRLDKQQMSEKDRIFPWLIRHE